MKVATSCELILKPGVAEFVKRRAAEEEFQTTCELVRSCFSELQFIRAYLQEDPDEDDRSSVILDVTVPASHPLDLLQTQRCRFSEQLVQRLPPERFPDPVCGLLIRFGRG